jgi:tRNA threonylcarbamoyladenosine biosynthesis protein TsaB
VPAEGLVLGIETATALGGVALVSGDGRILGEMTLLGRESHSERIIPAAGDLVASLGFTAEDIAAVAVSRGPGSFTGLRTGLAAAKGLAFSRGVPLFGVPTLEALAANAPAGSGPVCAVLNARRGEVYRALFSAGTDGPVRQTPDELISEGDLAAGLPAGCLILGEPPSSLRSRRTAPSLRFGPAHLNHPRAAAVALAGREALRSGRASELASLLPGYLRAAGVERPIGSGRQGLSCNDKGFRDRLH